MAEFFRFQLSQLPTAPSGTGPTARPIRPSRAWPLSPGRNRIGSDPANDIRFSARGVSRFHAEIHCTANTCELEDLRSKNGSRVNGRPVRRQAVQAGDIVTFGDSRWLVETVASDDVELALDIATSRRTETPAVRGTSKLGDVRPEATGLPYPLLAALLGRLRQRPNPDLTGALIDLLTDLGAAGACIVEWPAHGPATLSAAVGQLGEIPERADCARAHPLEIDPQVGSLVLAPPHSHDAVVFVRHPGRVDRLEDDPPRTTFGPGLVIFGPGQGETGSRPTATATPWTVAPALPASFLLLLEDREVVTELPRRRLSGQPQSHGLRLPEGIVAATSGKMLSIYAQLAQVADDAVPVMILGETGVGKEHLARALHDTSDRHDRPFVAVNCAAIPAELLEAEMFGIGRGVATGVQARRGKFRDADGGTLFLDEIGDMPPPLQAKLLRVLQEGEVTPVGESTRPVDVRLVSASHADLPTAIAQRRFRQDLYYRLAGYVLPVPALRDRPDDLPVLIGHFLRTYGDETGRRVRGVTVKALRQLANHSWPGNVRQLQHVARRLIYLCSEGQAVDSAMVREALAALGTQQRGAEAADFVLGAGGLDDHLAVIETDILRRALERTEGNRSKAARLLRISRNSLARRLDRLGIDPNHD